MRLPKDMADRGLFIVGPGRSGTTIFLTAMNCSSKDILLPGEMAFYHNFKSNDFIQRHNAFYKQIIASYNLINSSNDWSVPKLLLASNLGDNPQSFWSVMEGLFKNYKYVGEKTAFLPWVKMVGNLLTDRYRFLDFQTSYFPGATYICLFRNPKAVVLSTLKTFPVFQSTRNRWYTLQSLALSYFVILELFFSMPVVPIIEHEAISQATFNKLSEILHIDVRSAFSFYQPSTQHRQYTKDKEDEILQYDGYEELVALYEGIVSNIDHDNLTFINTATALEHYRIAIRLAKMFAKKAEAVAGD